MRYAPRGRGGAELFGRLRLKETSVRRSGGLRRRAGRLLRRDILKELNFSQADLSHRAPMKEPATRIPGPRLITVR